MAEVYLCSVLEKSLELSSRLNDVVSAGVTKVTPDQKLQPTKLERLFKTNKILHCWPQKPERLLLPEDALDFDYILTLNAIDPGIPYQCWADDNPDEAQDLKEKAEAESRDWRAEFEGKVELLRHYGDPTRRDEPLLDPIAPKGSKMSKFGIRIAEFEKLFERIRRCVDQFLLKELAFDVETNHFIKDRI